MHIESIRIESFKQYQQPFELNNLSSGLNILVGDNEAGKSTLVTALRAVLFERHDAKKAVDAFTPYTQDTPSVQITFHHEGKYYQLEKVFSQKRYGKTLLQDAQGQQWHGKEAENHLAELLGFETQSKNLTKPEERGVHGVLWVEQGQSWHDLTLSNQTNPQFFKTLHQVLGGQFFDLLSQNQGGAELLQSINKQVQQYWTATGKPKRELNDLKQAKDQAQQVYDDLSRQLENHRQKIDELTKTNQELAKMKNQQLREKALNRLQQAEAKLNQLQDLKERHSKAQNELRIAELHYKQIDEQLHNRNKAIGQLNELNQALREKEEQKEKLARECREQQQRHHEAKEKLKRLEQTKSQISQNYHKARKQRELADEQKQMQELDQKRQQAREIQDRIRQLKGQIAAAAISEKQLSYIQSLRRQVTDLASQLNAASTTLDYAIKGQDQIYLDDERLQGEDQKTISEPAQLYFGQSSVTIKPSQTNLAEIREQYDHHQSKLQQALDQVGAASVEEAEAHLRKLNEMKQQVETLSTQLTTYAPNGLDQLEAEYNSKYEQVQHLKAHVGEQQHRNEDEAYAKLQEAEQAYQEQESIERQAYDDYQAKNQQWLSSEETVSDLKKRIHQLDTEIKQARTEISYEQLQAKTEEYKQAYEIASQRVSELASSLNEYEAQTVQQEYDKAKTALESIDQQIEHLKTKSRDLSQELKGGGHQGLAEQLEEAEQRLAVKTQEYQRLHHHAQALYLLNDVLNEAYQQMKQQYIEPVVTKLNHYLRILLPQAQPELDDNFNLKGIKRGQTREDFDHLSLGTREQLAVLLRLAFADVLAGRGSPSMVVLDDALVNSDDDRRERMKHILYQAAQNYQILFLTCHGAQYRDCGGHICEI